MIGVDKKLTISLTRPFLSTDESCVTSVLLRRPNFLPTLDRFTQAPASCVGDGSITLIGALILALTYAKTIMTVKMTG